MKMLNSTTVNNTNTKVFCAYKAYLQNLTADWCILHEHDCH